MYQIGSFRDLRRMLTSHLGILAQSRCKITVDMVHGGAVELDGSVASPMNPNALREMAQAVIAKCVARSGTGGFLTFALHDALEMMSPNQPKLGSFYTVAVSSPTMNAEPGETDPEVLDAAMAWVGKTLEDDYRDLESGYDIQENVSMYAKYLFRLTALRPRMEAGGTVKWTGSTPVRSSETE